MAGNRSRTAPQTTRSIAQAASFTVASVSVPICVALKLTRLRQHVSSEILDRLGSSRCSNRNGGCVSSALYQPYANCACPSALPMEWKATIDNHFSHCKRSHVRCDLIKSVSLCGLLETLTPRFVLASNRYFRWLGLRHWPMVSRVLPLPSGRSIVLEQLVRFRPRPRRKEAGIGTCGRCAPIMAIAKCERVASSGCASSVRPFYATNTIGCGWNE